MSAWPVPYLTLNGNCEEAVKFYQKVLGGETSIMRYGDAPPDPSFPVPDSMKNLVMHAQLKNGEHVIYLSDAMPNAPVTAGNNISFVLEFATKEETAAMFKALSEGGKIEADLQETFFSPLYGRFTDKFGIAWQLLCSMPQQ